MKRLCILLLLCCMPVIFVPIAIAQNSASIIGNVTDSSGAAMPNVKIVVSLPSEGFKVSTVSDTVGAYRVGFLGIGDYTITAEAPGFQKLLQEGVHLELGVTQRVDLVMKVGTTTQEITVTGNIVKVQTDESVLATVITGTQISAINLNGREWIALATLVPGATVTNSYNNIATSQGESLGAYIAFNGTHTDQAEYAIDGGNLNNFFANGNFHTTPSMDSIAEFKTSTANYEADQGIKMGGNVEMTTKSGTKDFHGDMYNYVRNDVWDSNPWFVNQEKWNGLPASDCAGGNNITGPCNAPKAPLKWNDFGWTIGGPFFIPGHYNTNKDKTFVFWSTEMRHIRAGSTLTSSAPTARMRVGDFSECDNTSPNYNSQISGCNVPKDPATGLYYTREGNGLVPVAPQAAFLLSTWVPSPNNGPTGWINSPDVPSDWRQNLIRVDQNLGEKNRFYVRIANDNDFTYYTTTLNATNGPTYNAVESFYGGPLWSWTTHMTSTISPTVVNDFMYHYDEKHNLRYNVPGPGWGPGVLQKPAGWSMPTLYPANQAQTVMPGFNVSGSDGMGTIGEDTGFLPQWTNEENQEYQDTLQITRGHHYIKMGLHFLSGIGDFNNNPIGSGSSSGTAQGELAFSTSSTISSGNAFADMLLGNIYTYSETSASVNGNAIGGYFGYKFYVWRLEPYIQDDWRVNKRLTLNIGVRAFYLIPWEDQSAKFNLQWHGVSMPVLAGFYTGQYNEAVEAPLNAAGNFAPNAATGQIFTPKMLGNGLALCGQAGIPKGCMFPNGVHFAPRFGFAYQPFSNPNTVIRGGFGVFFDQMSNNDPNPLNMANNVPIYQAATATNTVGYTSISPSAYGPPPYVMLDSHLPYPRSMNFTFGFQHEFRGNNRLAVNYVGTNVKHDPRTLALNRVSLDQAQGTINVPALAGTTYCDASGNCNVQNSLIYQKHSINFFRPYEGYTTISQRQTTASSEYNGLQFELRHPVGHGLTLEAAYTYSKYLSDNDSYSSDYNIEDDDLRRYWSPSTFNRTNVVSLQYVYDLPFLKNNPNHYVKNAFGGWQLTGVTSFFGGVPINITCSVSGYSNGTGTGNTCNSLGPIRIQKGVDQNPTFGPEVQWYNPANLGELQLAQLSANNQPGMFGWTGIDPLQGPGRNNFDLALLKNFQAPWFKGEHSTIQFRWETYNTFNHPQWQGISSGCSSTTPFGSPCNYAIITNANGSKTTNNLGQGDVTSAWNPRIMQFALKLIF
jgi:hypothetical protein